MTPPRTTRELVPNALIELRDRRAVAALDHIGGRQRELDASALMTLEAFVHFPSVDGARDFALTALATSVSVAAEPRLGRARRALHDERGVVLASARGLRVIPYGIENPEGHVTLTQLSRRRGSVLLGLFDAAAPSPLELAPEEFASRVDALVEIGLLAPARQQIDWGDFARAEPMCQVFGMGRGTGVDRHYLARFVDDVRPLIVGDVVDVGGSRLDRVRMRLEATAAFTVLDVAAGPHVDVVGDVHDPGVLPPASCDSVLLFNVLEHCRDPRAVALNIHRWLRPGGRCFVMVPSAQRLHNAPDDYWRFSAAGLRVVFEGFDSVATSSYGNLAAVIANFSGIAAEELSAEQLDTHRADYPVATCAVAQK